MKFLLGIGFGAIGMWAYQSGKLGSLTNSAPAPVQQVYKNATERINQVADNDQLRQVASTLRDKVQPSTAPQIAMPTPGEVAGRPSEPLPRYEPEDVQIKDG